MTVADAPPKPVLDRPDLPEMASDVLLQIDPRRLTPHPHNPRKDLGDLTDMAASIREKGVLEPLLCVLGGIIVCGHRRREAAILAGVELVPVLRRDLTEAEQIEAMLVENLQRSDLTALEEAQAYQQLLDLGAGVDEISQHVGTREERIRKRTALLQLPNNARAMLDSGAMTMAAAEKLLKLRGHPEVMERILASPYRARATPQKPITELYEVDQELDRIKVAEKSEKAIEAAKAKGLKVVKMPSWNDAKRKELGTGYGCLNVDAKEHAKLKCHAVAVDDRGTTRPVCTRPADHAGEEPAPAKGGRARPDYESQRIAKVEFTERRHKLITEALAGDPRPVHDLTMRLMLADRGAPGQVGDRDLCAVLGISHEDEPGRGERAAEKAFTEWLVEGDLQPLRTNRALAAIVLLSVDSTLDDGEVTPATLMYGAWLQDRGFDGFAEGEDGEGWPMNLRHIAAWRKSVADDPAAAYVG